MKGNKAPLGGHESIKALLKRHGLRLAEYHVLSELWECSKPYAQVVVDAYQSMPGLMHCEEYIGILDRCLKRKLVCHVSAEQERKQRRQFSREKFPTCNTTVSRFGDVDLSARGYRLYLRISRKTGLLREVGARFPNNDESHIEVYGRTLKAAHAYLDIQHTGGTCFIPGKPRRIKRWRLSRFEVVKGGFVLSARRASIEN